MNFVKFTIYTLFGSLIWNIVLTYTGFILGDHWERIGAIVGQYEKVIIVVCILLFILYVGRGVKDVLRSRVKK